MPSPVIRGKHLAQHHINHDFLHNCWVHREGRSLHHLCDALEDIPPEWCRIICDNVACDVCLRANSPRLGPSGGLPRVDGLFYIDVFHMTMPDMIFKCQLLLGITHSTSNFRKSVRMKSKKDAPEAIQVRHIRSHTTNHPTHKASI